MGVGVVSTVTELSDPAPIAAVGPTYRHLVNDVNDDREQESINDDAKREDAGRTATPNQPADKERPEDGLETSNQGCSDEPSDIGEASERPTSNQTSDGDSDKDHPLSLARLLFTACDSCVYCGGKFVG